MTGGTVEQAHYLKADLGESPTWDAALNSLWFVDALAGEMHRLDWDSKELATVSLGHRIGGLALAEDSVLAMADGAVVAVSRGPAPGVLRNLPVPAEFNTCGLHDCGVDSSGAVWVGTLSKSDTRARGELLRLSMGGLERTDIIDGYRLPNGIAWSPDFLYMYVVDSKRYTVFRSRFDGSVEIERIAWLIGKRSDGLPDGICVDLSGGVWVAYWGSGRVVRYDSSGRSTDEITLPVRYATSCCFGGPGLRSLFVTSARYGADPDESPLAGMTFVTDVAIPGAAVPLARIGAGP